MSWVHQKHSVCEMMVMRKSEEKKITSVESTVKSLFSKYYDNQ